MMIMMMMTMMMIMMMTMTTTSMTTYYTGTTMDVCARVYAYILDLLYNIIYITLHLIYLYSQQHHTSKNHTLVTQYFKIAVSS